MSERVDEIFVKFSNVFKGREEDIKAYMLKYFKKIFTEDDIIDLECIDATERIKKAGFQKNLSAWRNTYQNIIISTSLLVDGVQKRYDYKFYFTKEKLSKETIDIVDAAIKESNKLKLYFKFEEAVEKIDEMLELIRDKNDKVFNRKLQDIKQQVQKAEGEYNKAQERKGVLLEKIEEDFKNDNFEEVIKDCIEILKIGKKVRDKSVLGKYAKILEESQKKLDIVKEIEELDPKLQKLRQAKQFDEAMADCDHIIEMAESIEKSDLIEKFKLLKEKLIEEKTAEENRIRETNDNLNELEKELEINRDKKNFVDALSNCDKMIQLSTSLENQELIDKHAQLKQQVEREKAAEEEKMDDVAKEISRLKESVSNDLENDDLTATISDCEKIIELSKVIEDDSTAAEYSKIIDETRKKIEERKDSLERTLAELTDLEREVVNNRDGKDYSEALSNCEKIVQLAGIVENQELIEKYTKLKEEIGREKAAEEGKLDDISKEISMLKECVNNDLENEDLTAIISDCEKIIELSKTIEDDSTLAEYSKIIDETNKKIEERKNQLEKTLAELTDLEREVVNNREGKDYLEALSNCEKVVQLAGIVENQELIEKYTKLKEEIRREKATEEEKLGALSQELTSLEEKVKTNRSDGLLDAAISNCERIIQLSESTGDLELKEKYISILDELKREIEARKEAQKLLEERAKEIEDVIEIEENVMPLIEEFSIEDILGDLSDNINDSLDQIGMLLNEHRVEIKNEVSTRAVMKSASGEVVELEKTIEVIKSDDAKEASYTIQSGLTNPFDDFIDEAIITDVIPYNFEVTNIELNGKPVDELPDKTLTKDGMELNWHIKDVPPKESVEINYDLRRRVSRTIIFVLRSQVKIIKTHSNLSALDLQGLYEAKLPFTNSLGTVLNGVIIEDIIPLYYVHFIKEPTDFLPAVSRSATQGDLVKWNIGKLEASTLKYHYKLLELFKFEELKIETSILDKEGLAALDNEDLNEVFNKFNQKKMLFEKYIS